MSTFTRRSHKDRGHGEERDQFSGPHAIYYVTRPRIFSRPYIPNENEGRKGKARCETATSRDDSTSFYQPPEIHFALSFSLCKGTLAALSRFPLLWSSPPLFGSRLHKCVHPLGWSREPSWLEGGEKKNKKRERKKKERERRRGRKRRRKATKAVLTDASRNGIGFPLTSWWNICPDS